jgi:glucuronate isomerase
LNNDIAETLYHDYARAQPIIDYHNHLPPDEVAQNKSFDNITQAWLYGDHYKWRALRANGVDEQYITGSASDEEKFQKWAETVPYTLRNPLYHWTHLELQRYFGVRELLGKDNATAIYRQTSELLRSPEYTVQGLLHKMNVEVICTTDDPLDNLEYHQQYANNQASFRMFPAFRPDKAMNSDDIAALNVYIDKLEGVTNRSITNLGEYLDALKSRHDYFAENGCTVSDHGLEQLYAEDYTLAEITAIFAKIRVGKTISHIENLQFKSAMLVFFAQWNHEKGWVQQYHLGPIRNNNTRLLTQLGPDTGFDSIGDFSQARSLSKFLNKLDSTDQLTKTILYNQNPSYNEVFATMAGNFNDGTVEGGKVQFGAAWWFLDQKEGMINQLNTLSNMGLISKFVGMLTDSRSFLSFPRHEYFRRIVCNLFAEDIVNGELPNDIPWIGSIIEDICYRNTKKYFGF